jgi:hypothetical protein
MPEKFISFPVADLDGNNLPTTLANALLHSTTSLTGLTNGVARRAFVLQNPSPSFTPSGGVTYTLGAVSNLGTRANGATLFSVTSDASARKMILEMTQQGDVPDSITFNGVTNSTPILNVGSGFSKALVYVFDVPSGVSGAVTINRAGGDNLGVRVRYGFVPSTATIETPVSQNASANNATLDVSQTVAAGSVLLVGRFTEDNPGANTRALNWSGRTDDTTYSASNFTYWQFSRKSGLSAGTETITSTNSGESGSFDKTLYSIEISA